MSTDNTYKMPQGGGPIHMVDTSHCVPNDWYKPEEQPYDAKELAEMIKTYSNALATETTIRLIEQTSRAEDRIRRIFPYVTRAFTMQAETESRAAGQLCATIKTQDVVSKLKACNCFKEGAVAFIDITHPSAFNSEDWIKSFNDLLADCYDLRVDASSVTFKPHMGLQTISGQLLFFRLPGIADI